MNHRSTHYKCKKTFLFKSAKKANEEELVTDPGYHRRGWGANSKEGENLLNDKIFAENREGIAFLAPHLPPIRQWEP